jgi:hypothetical protein
MHSSLSEFLWPAECLEGRYVKLELKTEPK